MAWTDPMTAVAANTWSAAEFNVHVRDNLLQTGPGIAGATTRAFFVQTGDNIVGTRKLTRGDAFLNSTTTSTVFVSLPSGPSITLTTDTTALVIVSADLHTFNIVGFECAEMTYAVSGATTIAADEFIAITNCPSGADHTVSYTRSHLVTNLNPGSNTFEAKYRSTSGTTVGFDNRYMAVIPL